MHNVCIVQSYNSFPPPKLKKILLREGVVNIEYLPCPIIPNSLRRHLLETFSQKVFTWGNGMDFCGGCAACDPGAKQDSYSNSDSEPFSSITAGLHGAPAREQHLL